MMKRKWYLTAAGEGKESFLHSLLQVIRKAADLKEFDRMAQRFGTNISKTAQLAGDTVEYGTAQQTFHSPFITNYTHSEPGNIETGPWINRRELPSQMN
ncbi:hypothetical protein TNCV_3337871 [Trichonephila clavipes]|nr:hypothetical protein TNCV_3337871 [Trichonephila clavipes]